MSKKPDPQAIAAFHFFGDPAAPAKVEDRLRLAVNAAIIAERRSTLAYWLCRWRQKLIWFGGWEESNCGGWSFKTDGCRWMAPFPLTVASALTLFGDWWQLKLPGTILVWSIGNGVYLSPDGTPRSATRWLIGKRYGS